MSFSREWEVKAVRTIPKDAEGWIEGQPDDDHGNRWECLAVCVFPAGRAVRYVQLNGDGTWFYNISEAVQTITHWMPMPELPA